MFVSTQPRRECGTNRVVDMCREAGIPAPIFEEITGAAVVTFRVNVAGPRQVSPQVTAQVTEQVAKVLKAARTSRIREELQAAAGIAHREHFRLSYLKPLLAAGWLGTTIPDKPQSRLQKYRLTEVGAKALKEKRD